MMNRRRYESLKEARPAVEEHLSSEVIDDAFKAVDDAAKELIVEYELDDVDVDEVRRSLKIGWCENAVAFIDVGVWEDEHEVRGVIDSIERNPVSNALTISGTVGRRNRDMMRVSGEVLKRKYSSE